MAGTVKQWTLALAFVATALGGCAQEAERPPQPAAQAPAPDDDAYCQAKGFKPGSSEYVKCRKDRDYVAARQAEQQQDKYNVRKMQDFMMDHH